MCCSTKQMSQNGENDGKQPIRHGFWAAPQAVTGKVIVVEIDGIDMKKLFVNFFFVTADRYTTLALRSSTRSKWENRKIVFFDLQKIFYVSCHAQKFHVTPKKYCVDSRSQNVRSVFQKKVITNQPGGQAWRILLYISPSSPVTEISGIFTEIAVTLL